VLDHITFGVADLERCAAFYDRALAVLGVTRLATYSSAVTGGPNVIGYGAQERAYFWLQDQAATAPPLHVAFAAPDRATVDAFYAAALQAGGRDNGAPGLRPHYHPNYYGAFVLDPEGRNIEAVCRAPE